jgi:hypothetical protein
MCDPIWLPPLVRLHEFSGEWPRFLEFVFGEFHAQFIASQPKFRELWVRCRRDPMEDGKEAGFWHCTQGGREGATVEIPRMERIRWVRAVIEHADDPQVDVWMARRGSDKHWCLWFREEYLVVLAERIRGKNSFRYWQLVTAYDTPEEHRRHKLRRERDLWRQETSDAAPANRNGVGTPSTDGG